VALELLRDEVGEVDVVLDVEYPYWPIFIDVQGIPPTPI
jgi:hypothetical protein